MANEKLTQSLDELLAYVEAAANQEAALGPTWLADLSSVGIGRLRELRASALAGTLIVGPDFDVADLLNHAWVELHIKVDSLVEAVNYNLRRS